jgi:hypothetical protein
MSKQSGLGDGLFLDDYDLSGDVGSLQRVAMPIATLDVTGINKRAHERIPGQHDGAIDYSAFWNASAGQSVPAFEDGLNGGADRLVTYCRGLTLGSPAASMLAKQTSVEWTRGQDGALTAAVSAVGSAYGLDWGELHTAAVRTDTAATNGASVDGVAATAFGWQAYLHVLAFTGTSVTVAIEDSANNSTWAAVTGGAFVAATAAGIQRLAGGRTATLRRYVRVVTTGTFTNAVFVVNVVRNQASALT